MLLAALLLGRGLLPVGHPLVADVELPVERSAGAVVEHHDLVDDAAFARQLQAQLAPPGER